MAEDTITTEEHDAGVVPADKTVGENINLDSAVTDLASSLKLADKPIETPPADGQPPQEQVIQPNQTAAPAAQPAAPTDRAPDTWRKEAQAAWATLDPTIRAEVQKREADIAKYVHDVQPRVTIAENLEKSLAPFAPVLEKYNINPWQHMQTLFAAHYNLVFSRPEVKLDMMRTLCRDIGINPAQLADPNAQPDAVYDRMSAELRARDERIARLERGVTGVTGQFQEARTAELSQGIMQFAADTEAHPFFWDLIDDVKELITKGSARSLEEAYGIAELRNPETRGKRLELENAKARAASNAANATRVASARKATSANVQSRGAGKLPQAEESIHDTIAKNLKEIRNRAH